MEQFPEFLSTKGKVCSSCISRGTISRSSLESRIRFLPSSMPAILAFWSPPGTAEAGTADTPPPIAPIPDTLVGIAVVCRSIVSIDYRSKRWRVNQSQPAAERHIHCFRPEFGRSFVRSFMFGQFVSACVNLAGSEAHQGFQQA